MDDRHEQDPAAGFTAAELAERANRWPHSTLSPGELRRWLLVTDLAVEHDGRLRPTSLAHEIGAWLAMRD